jgi:adenylate cyclase
MAWRQRREANALLELSFLGEMRVSKNHVEHELPRSKKTRALLAYLALTARTHRRDRLCATFWEVPDDPRGALRWSLSKLRALVDDSSASRIVADRETVEFQARGAAIDLIDLRTLLSGDLARMDTEVLKTAADAFRGEALEGLDLPECHEFHAWYVAQRADARALQARVASALVDRLVRDPEAALPYARTLTLIETEREAHWASLGRILAAAGRRREAEEQSALGLRVLESAGMPASGPLLKVIRNLRKSAEPDTITISDRPAATPSAEAVITTRVFREGQPRIVVLPFKSLGMSAEQEFFAEGITDDLTTTLSRVLGLFVIARSTALAYKDVEESVCTIAKSLGVRYALHGTVRTSQDRVRVTACLVDSDSGDEIWSDRLDSPLDDVFAVQDRITTDVVRALQVRLLEGEQARVWHRSTSSVEAWSYLTQGLASYKHQTREGVTKARRLFLRATEIDPNYAAAWAWLAYAHWHDARFLWTDNPEAALERASGLAERALALDNQLSEVHGIIAAIRVLKRDYDSAIAAGRIAVQLDPNSAEAAALLAFVLNWACEPAQALWFADKAVTSCPLHSGWYRDVRAHALMLLRRYEEAVPSYLEAIANLPHYIMPRIGLATCYAEMNRLGEAHHHAEQVVRIDPSFSTARHTAMSSYRDEAYNQRRLDAMRVAGLPE